MLALLLLAACGSNSGSKTAATTAATAGGCGPGTTAAGSDSGLEVNPPGDIPDDQAFVTYSPKSATYSIKVPEGWARTEQADHASFTDKLNSIDIQLVPLPKEPTVDSVKAELPKIASSASCYEAGNVTTVTRKGGTAVLVTYRADGEPDPVTGKVVLDDVERYAFWKGGTAAVITLSGSTGSDNVDPWKIVTDSFTWK